MVEPYFPQRLLETGGKFRKFELSFLLIFYFSRVAFCEREVLFDSTESGLNQWSTRSVLGRSKSGWVRVNGNPMINSPESTLYYSCDVGIDGVQNFLVSPFIGFQPERADILYCDITYTVTSCDESKVRPCKENIQLGYLEASSQKDVTLLPLNKAVEYTTIKPELRDEADPLSDSQQKREIKTTQFFVPRTSRSGIALVFEDNGACVGINAIQVYQKVCPEIEENFALFPKSLAPVLPFETVAGNCVANAEASGGTPRKQCLSGGMWDTEKSTSCQCKPGFSPGTLSNTKQCQACAPGSFKAQSGDGSCQICPKNSNSRVTGATICECDPARFRLVPDDPYSQCYSNPSAPRNVRVVTESQENQIDSIKLSWNAPFNDGSDNPQYTGSPLDLWYSVDCKNCDSKVKFQPSADGIRTTYLVVTGLQPETTYHFRIFSHNRVDTIQSPTSLFRSKLSFADFNYTTPAAVFVRNLRVSTSDGSITAHWLAPIGKDEKPINVSHYYVRVRKRLLDTSEKSMSMPLALRSQKVPGNRSSVEFAGLDAAEYLVDVSTSGLNGPYCAPVAIKSAGFSSSLEMQHRMQRIVLTVILLILVFLLFISIFTIALCFYRKKQKWGYAAAAPNGSMIPFQGQPGSFSPNHETWWGMSNPLDLGTQDYIFYAQDGSIKLPVGQKFADPKMFESPERLLAEFTREFHPRAVQRIPPTEAEMQQSLGGMQNQIRVRLNLGFPGGFSDHYNFSQESTSSTDLASNQYSQGGKEASVVCAAAKTLKSQCTPDMWRKFAVEAATIAQFNHPNVVMLHGVVTASEESPKMLILEYCERGSLDALLPMISQFDFSSQEGVVDCETNKQMESVSQITHILRGVACGMHYLADEGYVHKVLRARNVFISKSFMPKIAGFDERTQLEEEITLYMMSMDGSNFYDIQKPPLVLETVASWTAPEALAPPFNFSLFSDIWSFGCLIFECFSEGEKPFGSLKSSEISRKVSSNSGPWRGFSKPSICPDALYELMNLCCVKETPQKRPWFSQIKYFLDNLVRSRNMLQCSKNNVNYEQVSPKYQRQSSDGFQNQYFKSSANPTKPENGFELENPLMISGNSFTIEELLEDVKLGKYCENFKLHGYCNINEILYAIEHIAHNAAPHLKPSRRLEIAGKRFFKGIGITSKKDRCALFKKVQSIYIQQVALANSELNNHLMTSQMVGLVPENMGRQYLDGTL